jgi:hypothetical protein
MIQRILWARKYQKLNVSLAHRGARAGAQRLNYMQEPGDEQNA